MKVGFIGLGIMGKPMAKNVVRKGFELCVYDLNPEAVQEMTELGAAACTPQEMAGKCDAILTILPNGSIVHEVLLGENGVCANVRKGTLVMDMSSITPAEAKACHSAFAAQGAEYLDAPVSGGEPKAIDGTLAFMVGGTERAFERAKPLFEAMGSSALLVGDGGAGCITKLANQVIVNLSIAALSEALVLATKAGADPEKVYRAIRGGLAGSTVLDAKVPLMLARHFQPGGKISINLKDIQNVMKTAHEEDVPMPLSANLLEIMTALKCQGHLGDDHGGIVQYYEKLAGVEVRGKAQG